MYPFYFKSCTHVWCNVTLRILLHESRFDSTSNSACVLFTNNHVYFTLKRRGNGRFRFNMESRGVFVGIWEGKSSGNVLGWKLCMWCFAQFGTIYTILKTWRTLIEEYYFLQLFLGCFSRFLNCTNGSKSCKVSLCTRQKYIQQKS